VLRHRSVADARKCPVTTIEWLVTAASLLVVLVLAGKTLWLMRVRRVFDAQGPDATVSFIHASRWPWWLR
jgi:hypothetical protein